MIPVGVLVAQAPQWIVQLGEQGLLLLRRYHIRSHVEAVSIKVGGPHSGEQLVGRQRRQRGQRRSVIVQQCVLLGLWRGCDEKIRCNIMKLRTA